MNLFELLKKYSFVPSISSCVYFADEEPEDDNTEPAGGGGEGSEDDDTSEQGSEPDFSKAVETSKKFDEESGGTENTEETEEPGDETGQEGNEGDGTDETKQTDADDKETGDSDSEQKVDADLFARAEQLGFTREEISGYKDSPQALEHTVSVLENRLSNQQNGQQQGQQQEEGKQDGLKFEDLGLDEDMLDPDVKNAFDKLLGHTNQLSQQVDQLVGHVSQQTEKTKIDNFDSRIENLGDDYSDVLGKGKSSELDVSSQEFSNREKLYDQMELLAAGYKQSGQQPPSGEALFKQAFNSLFGDKIAEKKVNEIKNNASKRHKQTLHRPSNQNKSPVTGISKAIQTSKEFDKKFNL